MPIEFAPVARPSRSAGTSLNRPALITTLAPSTVRPCTAAPTHSRAGRSSRSAARNTATPATAPRQITASRVVGRSPELIRRLHPIRESTPTTPDTAAAAPPATSVIPSVSTAKSGRYVFVACMPRPVRNAIAAKNQTVAGRGEVSRRRRPPTGPVAGGGAPGSGGAATRASTQSAPMSTAAPSAAPVQPRARDAAGKNRPPTSWAACTPDCFTPTHPMRLSGGTTVRMIRFVVGLEMACVTPATAAAAYSTGRDGATAPSTSAAAVPPKMMLSCARADRRSAARPRPREVTAAAANTTVITVPSWPEVTSSRSITTVEEAETP